MKQTHQNETWTYSQVETALCLWEAVMDFEAQKIQEKGPDIETGDALLDMRGNHGSFTMRAAVASLTDDCEAAWEAATALGRDHICFDFEFCPNFIKGAVESGLLDQAVDAQYGSHTPIPAMVSDLDHRPA